MPNRSQIRAATKQAVESVGVETYTTRYVGCEDELPELYATAIIAEAQIDPAYISDDSKKKFTAQLQIVFYSRTGDDDVLDAFTDAAASAICADTGLKNILEEMQYIGIEYLDEEQGYAPLATIFEITYIQ